MIVIRHWTTSVNQYECVTLPMMAAVGVHSKERQHVQWIRMLLKLKPTSEKYSSGQMIIQKRKDGTSMKATKCDMCGRIYDPVGIKKLEIRREEYNSSWDRWFFKRLDICDNCQRNIREYCKEHREESDV